MLKRFTLRNYKNFKDEITLDLGDIAGYQYNTECIHNNTITKALIYGRNATGKTNLGKAIMDIAYTMRGIPRYEDEVAFLNADSHEAVAIFNYYFVFESHKLIYEYSRKSAVEIVDEKLTIDDKVVFNCDFQNSHMDFSGLKYVNADTVNTDLYFYTVNSDEENDNTLGKRIPFIRWLTNNTVFSNDSVMMRFLNYVMRMSSIDNSTLAILGISRIMNGFLEGIKKTDGLKDFENFLNAMGIECSLVLKELPDNQYALYFSHDKLVPFDTASSGTKAATQLYRRLVSGGFGNAQSPSFVYMDEFDAYYHYEMSQNVIEYLKKNYPQTQIVFTTHNTVLMSNRIMRPDCLFLLSTKGNLTPLQKATERELREGHNLAKMYMSGEFEQYE